MSDFLPMSVINCRSCGKCGDFLVQDNGDKCGNCGCDARSHEFIKPPDTTHHGSGDNSPMMWPDNASLPPLSSTPLTSDKKGDKKATQRKRPASMTGDQVKKKPRVVSSDDLQTSLLQSKSCTRLLRGHLPVTDIADIPTSTRGVYKIAYNYKTIYVGRDSSFVKQALKGQFNGSGQKELHDFIKSLRSVDLEKMSVFWVDEEEHVHTCAKKTYLKCIEDEEGEKPRFNVVGGKKPSGRWCSLM